MATQGAKQSGPGRPRSREADEAILDAALELVAERGYEGLTMEAMAERAGVGKTTVYRRWPNRDEVLAAASERFVTEIGVPDTGTVRGDLIALLESAIVVYSGLAGRAMPGLVAAMARNPGIARSWREGFLAVRRAALRDLIERGIRRGELRDDVDVELTLDLLGGPLMYRLLVTGGAVDDEVARGVVDTLLEGIAGRKSGPQSDGAAIHHEGDDNAEGNDACGAV
jgi:AcrR family transcriptional regulator